jgi:hypothetical protein
MLTYFLEIVLSKFISNPQQFSARMGVCKGPDTKAVGGIKLPLEEFTTHILYFLQLQQTGSRE